MRSTIIAATVALFIAPLVGADTPDAGDAPAKAYRPLPSLFQWEVAGAPKDPIQIVNRHMGRIVGELADAKTDLPVQLQQHKVVSDLDTLIKLLEEQMKAGGSGGANPNPTRPMTKSVLTGGPGGSGPLHDPKAGMRAWGDLPAKEREQILQSQTEGFPPGYEAVLSSYFNRLAQEKVTSDTTPATQPSNP